MRKVLHLSPTSLSTFYKNQEEFYLSYLAETRPPRFPQTQPMSVGSAFDAYAKSYLHEMIFGKGNDPRFELSTLFEAQVEAHNRDWAWDAGRYAFEVYKALGCFADLMTELGKSVGDPHFEIEVKGVISHEDESFTALGKPDITFLNNEGCHVLFDWKVNGFCSKTPKSPMPGYVKLRGDKSNAAHKKAQPMLWNGMVVNLASHLEDHDSSWATQIAMYAWLCGVAVGDHFIAAIDQLCCSPEMENRPKIRVAEHRSRVSHEFQIGTFEKASMAWDIIQSDHYFRGMTFEDSKARCELLDQQAAALVGEGTTNDAWFAGATRERD